MLNEGFKKEDHNDKRVNCKITIDTKGEQMRFNTELLISLTILLLTSGCSKPVIQGLKPEAIKGKPIVMVATSDLTCSFGTTRQGTTFSVKEIGGIEYKILSDAGAIGDMFALVTGGNTFNFPENVLLLKWNENMDKALDEGKGFVVYPNGKFAYEEYAYITYNTFGGNWWLVAGECSFDGEFPFELRDNR